MNDHDYLLFYYYISTYKIYNIRQQQIAGLSHFYFTAKMSGYKARWNEQNEVLEADPNRKRDWRNFQTPEKREERLKKMSDSQKERLSKETEIQKAFRLLRDRENRRPGLAHTHLNTRRRVVVRACRQTDEEILATKSKRRELSLLPYQTKQANVALRDQFIEDNKAHPEANPTPPTTFKGYLRAEERMIIEEVKNEIVAQHAEKFKVRK